MTVKTPVQDCRATSAFSPHIWTHRDLALALGGYALIWGLAVSLWWLRDLVIPWDAKNHFYPMIRYLAQQIHNGEWPFWNPYHFAGHPAIADPQSLIFTPTLSFLALFSQAPSMRAFDLATLAHLLVGGSGIIGLCRRRGWHPAAALFAAVIYGLGGSATARLQHVGIIVSYGLFPIAWLLLESALARRSFVRAIGFGLVGGLLAIDRDQLAYLCCLTLLAIVAIEAGRAEDPWRWLRERLPVLATMAATGAALLAVPVVLTLQFLADSNRPEFSYTFAANSSLHPTSLATLLFPNVFGNLNWAYNYWGPGPHTIQGGPWNDPAISYLGIGTIPAVLILWHGLAGRRLLAREARFFAIWLALGLVYALGRYTPVFKLLFEALPGVDLYRRPADATFIVNIALSLCAGYLLHRQITEGAPPWRSIVRNWRGLLASAAVVALIAGAIAAAVYFGDRADKLGFAWRQMAIALALALFCIGALWQASARPRPRLVLAALVVLVASGELVWRNAASALSGEPAGRYAVFADLPPDQLRGLQVLRAEIAERQRRGERPRVEILGLGGAWRNAAMVFQLEDTVGYNALRISDYERAVGSGENAVDLTLRNFPGTFRNYRSNLAALLGLEYLVLDRPLDKLPANFPKLDARVIYASPSMHIYRLNDPAPRTYLATRVEPVDTEEAIDDGDLPNFDRANAVLIAYRDLGRLKGDYGQYGDQPDTPIATGEQVRISRYRASAVAIDIDTPRPGILVLHDPYYPGWQVTVNGIRQPLLHANLLFRGVEVPAGRSHVEFSFEPLSMENLLAAASNLLAPDERAP
jgi:hypothetical protein